MPDEREDIVVLVDDNGDEVEFEHLDTIEMNGKEYVVLLPLSEEETDENEAYEDETGEEETDEVIILRIDNNTKGEESFVTIEDDDELNTVFEEFKQRMEDEYELYEDE